MTGRTAVSLFILSFCFTGCGGEDRNVLEASGTIEGTDVRVGSEVAGRVKAVLVDEGSAVATGDTLALIDDVDYQTELRQVQALVEAARAEYRLAEEGPRKEDIVQAEAALNNAEADYNRVKDLLASRTVTQKQYDDAYARFVSAQQAYEKLATGLRKEEILAARARWKQAEARGEQVKSTVGKCTIRSPANGVVTLRGVEPGEITGMGASLFRITKLDTVKLIIYVNTGDLVRVFPGQSADVTVDGAEGKAFPGKVTTISDVAEFTPKNVQTKEERTKLVFAVKVGIPNPQGMLKPGMPADARLTIAGSGNE